MRKTSDRPKGAPRAKPRRLKKNSPEQMELLRAEMQVHTSAAMGYGPGRDRAVVDAQWIEITDKLNSLGPTVRTMSEWKKVWTDVRLRSKKSEDELLMETLNNASLFYNAQRAADLESDGNPENDQETFAAVTECENNRDRRMEARNNRKRTTSREQFRLLKYEMRKHPSAAQGYATGKSNYKAEWREIVVKLNKLGPPFRTMAEWKKVWTDVCLRVKRNLINPPKRGKGRFIRQELQLEDELFTEYLHDEEEKYTVPKLEIQSANSTATDISQGFISIEKNPIDDHDYHSNNDDASTYHPDFEISEVDESQGHDVPVPQIENSSLTEEKPIVKYYKNIDEGLKVMQPRNKKKTSPEQFELMRAEMDIHTAAALGYGSGRDRAIVDAEWKEITEKLNAIGPPVRTMSEWKKVWSDVRLRSTRSMSADFQRNTRSDSEDDLLMETLNNASIFYNSQDSPEPDDDTPLENQQETLPAAIDYETKHQIRMDDGNSRKKKTTPEQFSLLKSEMVKNPIAAKGYVKGRTRFEVDSEWVGIVEKLNKLGPPYRTMTEWKKVWSDTRLRIKKNLGKPTKSGKTPHVMNESQLDDDNLGEYLNDSSTLQSDLENYTVPKIVDIQPVPSATNEISQSYISIEKNPLDEIEYHNNNDDAQIFRPVFENSEIDDTHGNDISGPQTVNNNITQETLNVLHLQSEQYDRILQHLTKISSTMSEVLHQQVTTLNRRNLLMEDQAKTNNFNSFLQRRQELRRNGRSKICEWF